MADLGRPLTRQPAGHEPSLASRLGLAGDHQAYDGRMRSFPNVLDSLMARETEDQRWLRNAAQWLRDNPDTSQEPS